MAGSLAMSNTFHSFLESRSITPSSFLFATGEAAKIVIQTLDNGQKVLASGLCRNSSYLSPFHHSSDQVQLDSALFRFLLQFANFLLVNKRLPIEEFLECGAFPVLLRSLASKCDHVRAIGYSSLSELYDLNLSKNEWQYHHQLSLFLDRILNSVTTPNQLMPSLLVHFLSCGAAVLTRPGHPIFMPLIKWLTEANDMRISSVPMFNDLFGQSGLDYRTQRNFIFRVIRNGIQGPEDVEMLRRHKVIDRLVCWLASPLSDIASRDVVLEILEKLVEIQRLEGLAGWILSVLNEAWIKPHRERLVKIAVNNEVDEDVEREYVALIAREAWKWKDRLDTETREKVEEILCELTLEGVPNL
jgi:nucleolar pre-ribosomal-associated protein 1